MKRNLLLFFLIVSSTAFADTDHIFRVDCQTDIAARFLSHLFGSNLINNICTAPPSASTIGEIFRIFNLGLLVFAGGFISYAAVSSALGKASDGGQAGGGKSNPWVPARLATGTMLLMPIQSGYSFIQLVVMWAVMQGVGLGNSLWDKQVELLGIPQTIEPQKSIQSTYDAIFGNFPKSNSGDEESISINNDQKLKITDAYAVGLCLAIRQKQNSAEQANDSSVPNITFGVYENCSPGKKINGLDTSKPYLCAGSISGNHQTDCGVFSFNQKITNPGKKTAYNQFRLEIKNQIMAAKENAMMNLDRPTSETVDLESCNNPLSVCAALKNMYTNIDALVLPIVKVEQQPTQIKNDDQWRDIAKQQGWITAGQYYYKFSSQSQSETSTYDYANSEHYLPKVKQGFEIPVSENMQATISKDNIASTLPATTGNNLDKLIEKFKDTIDKTLVKGYLEKNKQDNQDIGSINDIPDKKNPVTKGTLLLLDKIKIGLFDPLKFLSDKDSGYLDDDEVFMIESFYHSNRLTAPLDNLMVLMSLATGELTGFDIRKNAWVKETDDQEKIHDDSNQGLCKRYNGNSGIPFGCIRENAGIVGYLNSYYHEYKGKEMSIATIDPLTNLGNIGKRLVAYSMDYWINTLSAVYSITMSLMKKYSWDKVGIAAGSGLLSSIPFVGGVATALGSVGTQLMDIFFSLDTYNLSLFLPLGLAISAVLFIMGVMLGMYLPFIPFMIFTFTAIGWIMAVVEAMIAAPLVALGVTHPQGHDLLGKSEQAVILVLGIFIRPSAIVLGFIASIYLLKEVMVLINTGFLTLLNDVFQLAVNDGSSGVSQLYFSSNIMILGVLMVYVYIIMAVVNQVFSLIYQVPEKLLRWIGAAPENTGVSQIAGEVKQGMQSGGQSLAQGGQQTGAQKPEAKPINSDDIDESMAKISKDSKDSFENTKESDQDQAEIK